MRETGFIRRFFVDKKYGFIGREGAPDIFFHTSDLVHGRPEAIAEGLPVIFGVAVTDRGLRATAIRIEPPAAGEVPRL